LRSFALKICPTVENDREITRFLVILPRSANPMFRRFKIFVGIAGHEL
jgi:hypothetical protein